MRALVCLAALAGLAVFSCASASGSDPSASGENDLAVDNAASTNAADTVITPFGKTKRACVHPATSAAIDESPDTAGCAAALQSARGTATADVEAPSSDAEPPGWVSWADEDLASGVSLLQADFVVPPVPKNVGDQVIFIFPSLTPTSNPPIIQPVLQFGEAADGGGKYWSMASWYLDKEAQSWNSKVVRVNAGDKLRGIIQGTGTCSKGRCTSWTITTEDLTQPKLTTTLTTKGGNWAYVQMQGAALETYQMTSCAQYPSQPVLFTNILMKDSAGKALTPKWKLFDNSTATPKCGFTASTPAAGEIELSYSSTM